MASADAPQLDTGAHLLPVQQTSMQQQIQQQIQEQEQQQLNASQTQDAMLRRASALTAKLMDQVAAMRGELAVTRASLAEERALSRERETERLNNNISYVDSSCLSMWGSSSDPQGVCVGCQDSSAALAAEIVRRQGEEALNKQLSCRVTELELQTVALTGQVSLMQSPEGQSKHRRSSASEIAKGADACQRCVAHRSRLARKDKEIEALKEDISRLHEKLRRSITGEMTSAAGVAAAETSRTTQRPSREAPARVARRRPAAPLRRPIGAAGTSTATASAVAAASWPTDSVSEEAVASGVRVISASRELTETLPYADEDLVVVQPLVSQPEDDLLIVQPSASQSEDDPLVVQPRVSPPSREVVPAALPGQLSGSPATSDYVSDLPASDDLSITDVISLSLNRPQALKKDVVHAGIQESAISNERSTNSLVFSSELICDSPPSNASDQLMPTHGATDDDDSLFDLDDADIASPAHPSVVTELGSAARPSGSKRRRRTDAEIGLVPTTQIKLTQETMPESVIGRFTTVSPSHRPAKRVRKEPTTARRKPKPADSTTATTPSASWSTALHLLRPANISTLRSTFARLFATFAVSNQNSANEQVAAACILQIFVTAKAEGREEQTSHAMAQGFVDAMCSTAEDVRVPGSAIAMPSHGLSTAATTQLQEHIEQPIKRLCGGLTRVALLAQDIIGATTLPSTVERILALILNRDALSRYYPSPGTGQERSKAFRAFVHLQAVIFGTALLVRSIHIESTLPVCNRPVRGWLADLYRFVFTHAGRSNWLQFPETGMPPASAPRRSTHTERAWRMDPCVTACARAWPEFLLESNSRDLTKASLSHHVKHTLVSVLQAVCASTTPTGQHASTLSVTALISELVKSFIDGQAPFAEIVDVLAIIIRTQGASVVLDEISKLKGQDQPATDARTRRAACLVRSLAPIEFGWHAQRVAAEFSFRSGIGARSVASIVIPWVDIASKFIRMVRADSRQSIASVVPGLAGHAIIKTADDFASSVNASSIVPSEALRQSRLFIAHLTPEHISQASKMLEDVANAPLEN